MYPSIKTPGNGSFIKCIETACERKATVTGKPNPKVMDLITSCHHINKEECCFVGDNMHTDIMFANNCNISCILVMTGVTDDDVYFKLKDKDGVGKPTYIFKDLNLS